MMTRFAKVVAASLSKTFQNLQLPNPSLFFITMAAASVASFPSGEHGFSVKQGANWSEYVAYRPVYPPSFFQRIWEYHGRKPQAKRGLAHDVGAGAGIVSSALVSAFDRVAVSDPNEGYVDLARKALVEESGIPESTLQFFQEGAEKSSLESGTVDLITMCACIHWTDPVVSIKEANRQLRSGGTLLVAHYTRPYIIGNARAEKAWTNIWQAYARNATDPFLERAFPIINSAFDHLDFPESDWKSVERVYVNGNGSIDRFRMTPHSAKSNVKPGEKQIWVENDQGWSDSKAINWCKAYVETWVPRIPESEIQHLWDDFEKALRGGTVDMQTPMVMVFATKK